MNLKFQNVLINFCGVLSILGGAEKSEGLSYSKTELVPVVAVIDTGVDIQHPILKEQIWTNPGEIGLDSNHHDKSTNCIDDDQNGYIDDVHGWNFLANNNKIGDRIGHGTHIAGIIVSQSKNLKAVRGIESVGRHAPVKIMVLKFFDQGASGEKVLSATSKAIEYATKMKANFINYSAGGRTSSTAEYRALLKAKNANIAVIAAAGNEHTDNDLFPFFPASYQLSNITAVAATDQDGKLLSTSNFGKRTVLEQAPGKDIWSSLPNGRMGKMTGTSQATAAITAKMILERFKLNAIRRGEEELERMFDSELRLNVPDSKMTDLNLSQPYYRPELN